MTMSSVLVDMGSSRGAKACPGRARAPGSIDEVAPAVPGPRRRHTSLRGPVGTGSAGAARSRTFVGAVRPPIGEAITAGGAERAPDGSAARPGIRAAGLAAAAGVAWCVQSRRSSPKEHAMKTASRTTAPLGDLITAAFDGARGYSTDPGEVSLLATQAVAHMLRRLGRAASTSEVPLAPVQP